MVDDQVLRPERGVGGDLLCKGIGLSDLLEGNDKRKRLRRFFPDFDRGLDDDAHLTFGGEEFPDFRVIGPSIPSGRSIGQDHSYGEQLIPNGAVVKASKAQTPGGHPSDEGSSLSGGHAEEGEAVFFQDAVNVEKAGPGTDGELRASAFDLDRVHQSQIDQYPSMGGDGSAVSPGSGAAKRERDFVLPGKGKNLLDLFLRLRLENEIGTAVEQEIPDERAEDRR